MAHLRTQRAPLGGHIAIGEFDQVEDVLRVGVGLLDRQGRLEHIAGLTQKARMHHRQRLRTQGLGQHEVLVVPQAVAHHIAPGVEVLVALLNGADGVLPVIEVAAVVAALDNAAAREAQEAGVQIHQRLHQIGAQAATRPVRPEGIRRHQRRHVHINAARAVHDEGKHRILRIGGCEGQLVLLPLLRQRKALGHRQRLARALRQGDLHRAVKVAGIAQVHKAAVGLAGLNRHATLEHRGLITNVCKAVIPLRAGDAHIGGVILIEWILRCDGSFAFRTGGHIKGPAIQMLMALRVEDVLILKGAVLQ